MPVPASNSSRMGKVPRWTEREGEKPNSFPVTIRQTTVVTSSAPSARGCAGR